jgi:hypothetical protein
MSKTKKPGLWANIHAKRKRIAAGSGEKMRKKGDKGAPTESNIKAAQGKNRGGEILKEVPKDNNGLGKLPKEVRNRMGFMNTGGEAKIRKAKHRGCGAVMSDRRKTTTYS